MSIMNDTVQHPAYIRELRRAGGEAVQTVQSADPGVDAGLFDYTEWAPGKEYALGDLFTFNGVPGFARQAHTAQEHYPPFSVGVEALYGARPRKGPDGVYPYVYNMKAEPGMRVRSADGAVYVCEQAADPLLFDPRDVPALFSKEATE